MLVYTQTWWEHPHVARLTNAPLVPPHIKYFLADYCVNSTPLHFLCLHTQSQWPWQSLVRPGYKEWCLTRTRQWLVLWMVTGLQIRFTKPLGQLAGITATFNRNRTGHWLSNWQVPTIVCYWERHQTFLLFCESLLGNWLASIIIFMTKTTFCLLLKLFHLHSSCNTVHVEAKLL